MRARNAVLLISGILSSCGQDYNSHSGDAIYGRADAPVEGSVLFQEAFAILKRDCMGCHRGSHAAWTKFREERDWVGAGLVVPGNRKSSPLLTDLLNERGDMPLGGRPLSDSDYMSLVRWVEDMP